MTKARPETFDDLDDHLKVGPMVANIEMHEVDKLRDIQLTSHIYAMAAQFEANGFTVETALTAIRVHVTLTDEERAKALADEQEKWDRWKSAYDDYLSGEPVAESRRHGADMHAIIMGEPRPDWTDYPKE